MQTVAPWDSECTAKQNFNQIEFTTRDLYVKVKITFFFKTERNTEEVCIMKNSILFKEVNNKQV